MSKLSHIKIDDIVLVSWIDAWRHPNYRHEKAEPLQVCIVGRVLDVNSDFIKLTYQWNEDDFEDVHFIPERMIDYVMRFDHWLGSTKK